ncbi:MAG: STAS domain-containing protein [Planctomycetota bacterium]
MQIESQRSGDVLVIAATGRIDSTTSPELDRVVTDAFDAGESSLVIDMAGVDYISSLGLGALLKGAKRAKAGSGRIELCALQPSVLHVFTISGFDRILGIHESRDLAVGAVTAGKQGGKGGAAC